MKKRNRFLLSVLLIAVVLILIAAGVVHLLSNPISEPKTGSFPSQQTTQGQTTQEQTQNKTQELVQESVPEETLVQQEIATPLSELVSEEDMDVYLNEYTVATMLLSDGVSQIAYNEPASTQRYSPYSTFKIANSLISLEEGVISIGDSLRQWDGTQYSIPDFNQNQDMASAMKYSCVWYYQQLAREVGETAIQNYLNEINYGNMDISGGIDAFWLDSSLLVSPQEQLDFIIRFYNGELPFSQDNIDYVKSIIHQEGYPIELYGKTGSSGRGHGWFVGYTIMNEQTYYFATYIEGVNIDGPLVRDKTAEILNALLNK